MDPWKIISQNKRDQFLSFSQKRQNKFAATVLKESFETQNFEPYRTLEAWMGLPPLNSDHESISNRFHSHLQKAGTGIKEHQMLIKKADTKSDVPYRNIAIVLDNLRSAHNVGSIIRTTEAFRLGTLYIHGHTPNALHAKVEKSAMGAEVPTQKFVNFDKLPRPIIALETVPGATHINEFVFPESFTLLVGNEEYGISENLLDEADHIVTIPLRGSKNSLNVSNAFAIAANQISCSAHFEQHTHLKRPS